VPLSQQDRETLLRLINSDPVAWMENNFIIPDPRDPETGELFPPGPIRLAEHQKRIVRAATARDPIGNFLFVTIVYSAVKKSGKTRLGAGVSAWYAATHGPYNEVYCIANDGKQSADRILAAIKQSISLSQALSAQNGGVLVSEMQTWKPTKPSVVLPNGTFLEAIPCDPSGQAGANPGMTTWSEMWGYRHQHKERLWSEMTVPPTRWGQAIRWVESYAGYSGESVVLEDLYHLGTMGSKRHPHFPDLPVNINKPARLFCYWDRVPRMPWQTDEYYAQESLVMPPDEFRRIHRNEWVDPITKAIPIEWWDACLDVVIDGEALPTLDKRTPVVLALDAAVSHDCCAAVLISRHPDRKRTDTAVRGCKIWAPPSGEKIDFSQTMEPYVVRCLENHNVVMVAYDEFQLHKLCTDLRRKHGGRFQEFSQGSARAVADKQLYEMILHRQIVHGGHIGLRQHIDNAASKAVEDSKLRFIKMDNKRTRTGQTSKPIDALVAMSMANAECLELNLG
jgi:hypothetical protein